MYYGVSSIFGHEASGFFGFAGWTIIKHTKNTTSREALYVIVLFIIIW